MVTHLYPDFLVDPEQYAGSERFWEALWDRIDPLDREAFQWTFPWLGTGLPGIKDGNPIFSALSPVLRRGIRIIQEEPIGTELDLQAWLDTFGDDTEGRIQELVISCVLSKEASEIARGLMTSWVRGESPALGTDNSETLRLDISQPVDFE